MSYEVTLSDASFWIDGDDLERRVRSKEGYSLEDLLDDEHWALRVDRNGDIDDIEYKPLGLVGDMEMTLEWLAPVVRKGSFIEMKGEDGRVGRYDFDGKRCVASGPLFDEDEDEDD